MTLSRRALFRSAAAVAGVAAVTGVTGLAEEAVAGAWSVGRTTLDRVLLRGPAGRHGWRPVVTGAGEPHLVRDDLAGPRGGRRKRRTPVLAFVQLSDVHIVDAQSPLRKEMAEVLSSSAYRPHEVLTAHVAEAMVREINQIGRGPVTGTDLALALQTGDNSDNGQYNETRWNIDLLDGGTVRQDSGDLSRYEGVMDDDPTYYDEKFWHPGAPQGLPVDQYRKAGFPRLPGLLDECRRPFRAHGLRMEWFTAFGNHDGLWQGNFVHTEPDNAIAVGDRKNTTKGVRTVTPDPDRRLLSPTEMVAEHFATTGLPVGHGFTEQNRQDGTAYYTVDRGTDRLVRFIVLDSVNPYGGQNGSLDPAQFAWLQQQLQEAADRLVVVACHHPSWSMSNATVPTGAPPDRVLGPAVVEELLAHENVVAWVNGHTHRNAVKAHTRPAGGGFWEINTASHIDWPQQSRIIEVVDNHDSTLSIFATMVDHGAPVRMPSHLHGPVRLAALGRLLAANDPQEQSTDRRGKRRDRNVELVLPAPAFLRA